MSSNFHQAHNRSGTILTRPFLACGDVINRMDTGMWSGLHKTRVCPAQVCRLHTLTCDRPVGICHSGGWGRPKDRSTHQLNILLFCPVRPPACTGKLEHVCTHTVTQCHVHTSARWHHHLSAPCSMCRCPLFQTC